MAERRFGRSQVVATLLALIMLVSVGGTAFVGAAAGQVGGTYDQVTPVDDEDVSSDLNLTGPDDGTANLVGADSSGSAQGVDIADDGQVNITNPAGSGTFTGLTLTPERIADATSADGSQLGNDPQLADFLTTVPDKYNVSSNKSAEDAIPAVFIEFAPQSEFSQINNTDIDNNRTDGTHDFIVVAPANRSLSGNDPGDQLSSLVDTPLNTSNDNNINDDDIVAFSVDNTGQNADSSLLAAESNFGTVFDTLVGTNESDLQNKNIDRVEFAAGTFKGGGADAVTIDEVELADDLDTPSTGGDVFDGETIHSEKITLQNASNPATNTTFFDSVSDAVNASAGSSSADGSDTIYLDHGNYSELEGKYVNVSTDVTITTGARANDGADEVTRVNTTAAGLGFNDSANEAVIETQVNVSSPATIENIGISADTTNQPAVNATANGGALDNVIVNATGTGTAIDNTGESPENEGQDLSVTGSTILANDPVTFEEGEIGLDLNSSVENQTIANNYFIGFETQINGTIDKTRATQVFNANEDEFTDRVTPPHPSPNASQYADRDVAQSAVPFNGSQVNDTRIVGALNLSDQDADDGDVINVSNGTYNNQSSVAISTDEIELAGDDKDETVIEQPISLNGSNTVTAADFRVNATESLNKVTAINASHSGGVDLTIDSVNVSADAGNISVGQADTLVVQQTEFTNATTDAINITASPGGASTEVTVVDNTIQNLTDGYGIRVADAGAETINISNNEITGNTTFDSMDGINVSEVGTAESDDTLTVDDNDITGIGNGTALALNESTAERVEPPEINNNNLRVGTEGVGLEFNLDDSAAPNITSNVIVGNDVEGGSNSIGIDFVNITVTSTSRGVSAVTRGGSGAATISDNVITGHARVVNVRDSQWTIRDTSRNNLPGDYQALLRGATGFQNNTLGTVINGTTDSDFVYANAYGNDSQFVPNPDGDDPYDGSYLDGTTLHYLPGSVNESLRLVGEGPRNESELLIEDPEISSSVANVDVNKYEDDPVVSSNADSIDVEGENAHVEVESHIVINSTDRLNNYNFSDFTLDSNTNTSAVNLTDGHNSQSTFDNLTITSQGDGVVINANETDVNVVEVRNSDITLEDNTDSENGILFAHDVGDIDDRDGFVIHNNNVSGPGIDTGATGLNMTNVTKPGKEELDTQLTVTENFVTGFERQVEVTDPAPRTDANITALNFTSEQFEGKFDISENTSPSLTIDENQFGQQVLVFNTSAINRSLGYFNSDPDRVDNTGDYANLTLNDSDVFGSIDAAVEQAGENDTVRVYATGSGTGYDGDEPSYDRPSEVDPGVTEYEEDVDVTQPNVTIRGPSYQQIGTDTLTGPDALIQGSVDFDGAGSQLNYSRVQFTGFTVIEDAADDDVIGVKGGYNADPSGNITIENTSVTTYETSILSQEITGINISNTSAATPDNSTNITGVFAGDQGYFDDNSTNNTEFSSLTVANTTELTVEDSEFNGNEDPNPNTDLGADDIQTGVGVNLTNTSGTTTIENTTITNHEEEGVNVTGANETVTVTGSSIIDSNNGAGVVSTNENEVTFDLIIEDDTTVDNNGADGLNLDDGNISLTLTQSEVTSHTGSAGVLLQNVSNDSVINRTTIESNAIGLDVTGIHNDSNTTVVRNNAFDANANYSINNSGVNKLNASLNYFSSVTDIDSKINDGNGGVTIYDPFLTEDQTEQIDDPGISPVDADSASVTTSTEIGHDVVAPADSIITVGFPARPASNADTVGEAFDLQKINSDNDLALYKFEKSGYGTASFTYKNIDASDEIEFRDAFVVVNNGTTAESAGTVTYIDSREVPGAVATQQFSAGVNFVAPVGAGNVSEVLVGGGDNDLVSSGTFTSEANEYGAAGETNASFGTFGDVRSNFRNGVGTENVHPHRGYFVIAQNDSAADGQLWGEEVTVGGAPTAGTIDQKLDQTAD